MKYDFNAIEQRWQAYWQQHRTFHSPNPGDDDFDASRPKFYVLDMFPYPSGVGLHVGHPLGYIATDIVARYKRSRGYNVLHPMGFDAFGLPAEQFAVEHGVHPRTTTEQNIDNMVRQLKRLGLGYDWDRCVATIDPDYYKWTQWIFLKLYNSWFDPATNRARPIHELESLLESGELDVTSFGDLVPGSVSVALDTFGNPADGALRWRELEPEQKQQVIDSMRLAYLDEVAVNWCPQLGTVLANEEVTNDHRSERGNHPVYKRPMRQWMLRITAYCERLLDDLEKVDWPDSIKLMQRNWIGKSTGARVEFPVAYGSASTPDDVVTVFTTRPDTLFGATYMVLAPEHPLVDVITTKDQYHAVNTYRNEAAQRSELERTAEDKTKTGVFTGAFALNPVNNHRIPIWIADYVMMGYGTGAIMAVPAHDQRDFEFAKKYDLPIRPVVKPTNEWIIEQAHADAKGQVDQETLEDLWACYLCDPGSYAEAFTGHGECTNSSNESVSLNGLSTEEAKRTIAAWLDDNGMGKAQTQYKLRDWLFSRQRYWGEPFPIVHTEDGRTIALDESDLPVELPEMEDFRPEATDDPDAPPQPPLARAPEQWRYVEVNGQRCERELNTMPQWAGSCWYYLRFLDPKNASRFVAPTAEEYWMRGDGAGDDPMAGEKQALAPAPHGGVDLYVGGVEHAVLHLLYARFWHKVLFDLGEVSTPEPFGKLFNQGYIQAYYFEKDNGVRVPADEIEERDGGYFYEGEQVKRLYGKMGKSLKNAVAPDDVCEEYGCDTLRLYEMYMGPLDQSKVWNPGDIVGVHRFLQRLWRNLVNEETGDLRITDDAPDDAIARLMHKTIARVTTDMERMSFNTAIAALIELNNELTSREDVPREVAESMVLLLGPMAPHIAEELWNRLGYDHSVVDEPWPTHDPAMLVEDSVELPVQINGRVRSRITVPADATDTDVEAAAREDGKVKEWTEGKTVRKVIVIPGKMVNIVMG